MKWQRGIIMRDMEIARPTWIKVILFLEVVFLQSGLLSWLLVLGSWFLVLGS